MLGVAREARLRGYDPEALTIEQVVECLNALEASLEGRAGSPTLRYRVTDSGAIAFDVVEFQPTIALRRAP